jgi:hypothetical protein
MTRTGWVLVGIGAVAVAVAAKKKRRRSGYRSPGVYVEEVPEPPRPIQGVGTSTAAFVEMDPDSDPGTDPDSDPEKL